MRGELLHRDVLPDVLRHDRLPRADREEGRVDVGERHLHGERVDDLDARDLRGLARGEVARADDAAEEAGDLARDEVVGVADELPGELHVVRGERLPVVELHAASELERELLAVGGDRPRFREVGLRLVVVGGPREAGVEERRVVDRRRDGRDRGVERVRMVDVDDGLAAAPRAARDARRRGRRDAARDPEPAEGRSVSENLSPRSAEFACHVSAPPMRVGSVGRRARRRNR